VSVGPVVAVPEIAVVAENGADDSAAARQSHASLVAGNG
jgi:hypothetical protein